MACRTLGLLRSHRRKSAALALLLALVLLNAVAFMHARAMTRFVAGSTRTPPPESLSTFDKVRVLLTGVTVPRPINEETPDDLGLTYSIHHIASSDGIDLEGWFIEAPLGDSPGLVLMFTGYAAPKSACLPAAKVLHDLGYDTLLVDFRACGGSSGDDCTVGYREADDVSAAARYARSRFRPRRLVPYGASMGAVAVMRAASLDPSVADGLILEAPFDRLLKTVENRFHTMGVPAFPFARLMLFWGGVRQGYWPFAHNPVDYARSIRCPVLQMHGGRDPRVTLEQARAIFHNFAGPKRFVEFPDAGHESCLWANDSLWISEVREFLKPK